MSTLKAINIQEPSSANVNMLLDSSGNVAFQDGTALAPSITNNGDTNTGVFFPAADNAAISTGGSERFRVGSSGQLGVAGANYGTSGQVLTSGGASAAPSWASVTASGTLIRAPQVLTSGTSYTTPAGCVSIYVEAVGAGGAGGTLGGAIAGSSAGGGGAGGYCAKFFAVSASTAYTYAIGAGGTGAGGNTTFTVGATTITASGGGQGDNAGAASQGRRGGAGGTATNGDINITGNAGGTSFAAANNTNACGGSGAGSFFGGGGRGCDNANNGTAGTSGGGGGGATPSGNPGNGGSGLIRIWEFT